MVNTRVINRRGMALHSSIRRLQLLGLHPAAVPQEAGYTYRLHRSSPTLANGVTDVQIVRKEGKSKVPSDHAPVLVDLKH